MSTFTKTETYHIEDMECCGSSFGIPHGMYEHLQKTNKWFSCPFCKKDWQFTNKTREEKLKDELAQKQGHINDLLGELSLEKAATRRAKHQTNAQKGAKTKLQNRIAGGVCPCCNRTFKQLASHMKSQHPEYPDKP